MSELRTKVIWDGHNLSDDFIITDVQRGFPVQVAETQSVPGRDGAFLTSSQLPPLEIAMTLTAHGGTRGERREKMHRLMSWLDVNEPRRLEFTDDGGKFYEAVPSGGGERIGHFRAEGVTVSFVALEPAMYGKMVSVTVPSGGTATFRVGGNYRTRPVIEAASAVRGTSNLWGIRLDGGDYIRLRLGTSSARNVYIDCDTREAYDAGAATLPTLDSDWLEMEPGNHVISMDVGTGAATVRFFERWL